MRAFFRNRLHDLASPQGQGSLVKEGADESLKLLSDGMDAMFCAAGRNPCTKRYQQGTASFLDISHLPREAEMGADPAGPVPMVST